MNTNFARMLTIFSLLALLLGCSAQTVSTPVDPASEANQQEQEPIELRLVTAADVASELAQHKGKVVLTDMWAIW